MPETRIPPGGRLLPRSVIWGLAIPVILAIVVLPIGWDLARWHRIGAGNDWANWGAWLQGSLTPLALVFAALSFQSQQRAADRQAAQQRDANLIAERAMFIDKLSAFTGHINYRCYCAVFGEQIKQPVEVGRHGGFMALESALNCFDPVVNDPDLRQVNRAALTHDEIRKGRFYNQLAHEIDQIIEIGRRVELDGMLDGRIAETRSLIDRYPPTTRDD